MVLAFTSAPFFCLAKTGDCTFVLGTLGAGILSTCPHVPHNLKAWPRQLATLSTQISCNLNLPQNLMKCPKNRKNAPKLNTSHTASILASKLGHNGLERFSLQTPSIPPHSICLLFRYFFLLSTKTPPTVIHGFMARKELLGLHAARLQGATKY